jgi:hypothetical protein
VNVDAGELRKALRKVAHILEVGDANHPVSAPNFWQKLPVREHLRRAMVHLERSLLDVRGRDDDLAHAATRLLLALELRERDAIAAQSLKDTIDRRRAG